MKSFLNRQQYKWALAIGAVCLTTLFFAQRVVFANEKNSTTSTDTPAISESGIEQDVLNMEEVATELNHIQQVYNQGKLLTCATKYTFHIGEKQDSASMRGTMTTQKGNCHYKIEQFEYFSNEGKFLYIDHHEKTANLMLGDKTISQKMIDIETLTTKLLESGSNATIERISDKENKITMDLLSQNMETIEISYDPTTFLIRAINILFTQTEEEQAEHQLTITYGAYQIEDKKMPNYLKGMLVYKDKKYTLSKPLEKYQLKVADQ